jgi:hypothetical protein
MKCKTCHGKNEKKGEFGSLRSESFYFKGGTLIMLGFNVGNQILLFNP